MESRACEGQGIMRPARGHFKNCLQPYKGSITVHRSYVAQTQLHSPASLCIYKYLQTRKTLLASLVPWQSNHELWFRRAHTKSML
eukprot:1136913-Pelagomonas_calceolata.AAC.1